MTSLVSVNKYRLYCNTSSQWEYTFDTSTPSSCPINDAHTINDNSIQIIDTIECVSLTNTNSPYAVTQNSLLCDTTSGNIILNLPKATRTTNITYMIKKTASANTVTLTPNGSEQIDGLATKNITTLNDMVMIQSNGTGWATMSFYNLDVMDQYNSISINSRQKGDVLFDNSKELVPLTVGGNNYIILADSAQPTGTKWSTLNHTFLANGGTNTHAQIDTHIASSAGVHGITGNIVGINDTQTLTNKTIINTTNTIRATRLATTGSDVTISGSTAPTIGKGLIATSSTVATWQTITSGVAGSTSNVQYNNGIMANTNKINIAGDGNAYIGEYSGFMPAAPSMGTKLYSDSSVGKRILKHMDPGNDSHSFQMFFATRNIGWWTAQGNATIISNINIGNIPSGTATTRNVASTNLFTAVRRIGYVTSNPKGNDAGTCHGALQFWRGNGAKLGGFYYIARFGLATYQNSQRVFVGFANTASALPDADPSTNTNIIGFGSDAGDTSFTFMHNDGVGTATKDTLTGTFPSNTTSADMYEIRIFCESNDTTIYYYINNLSQSSTYAGSASSDIPSNTTLLCPQLWISNGNSPGVVGIDIVSQYIMTDY